jgi:phosphatidylinositol alpha-1,6-mannosyltransferase
MVESLSKLGWQFTILCEYYIPSTDEEIQIYALKVGVQIYRLPPAPSKLQMLKKILFSIRICKKYKPDLIIGTGRHPTWFASVASKLLRIPLLTIGHGTEFTQSTSKYDFRINKWAYGRSNLIISISEYTKEIILKSGIKIKNIVVIPNPANEEIFRKLEKSIIEKFRLDKNIQNRKIILTVGSLSERKGQRVIIESLPKIIETHPDIIYVAIGPPVLKDQFSEIANILGVSENVRFPGIVPEEELVQWINTCDFFMMTSVSNDGDYEGYGIAVIEAALCGKTSIVSDNGGLKEAVLNEETGLVIPENSVQITTNSILELLNDKAKLVKLSENAFLNARRYNTWNAIGQEYHKQLSAIIGKKK